MSAILLCISSSLSSFLFWPNMRRRNFLSDTMFSIFFSIKNKNKQTHSEVSVLCAAIVIIYADRDLYEPTSLSFGVTQNIVLPRTLWRIDRHSWSGRSVVHSFEFKHPSLLRPEKKILQNK